MSVIISVVISVAVVTVSVIIAVAIVAIIVVTRVMVAASVVSHVFCIMSATMIVVYMIPVILTLVHHLSQSFVPFRIVPGTEMVSNTIPGMIPVVRVKYDNNRTIKEPAKFKSKG